MKYIDNGIDIPLIEPVVESFDIWHLAFVIVSYWTSSKNPKKAQ